MALTTSYKHTITNNNNGGIMPRTHFDRLARYACQPATINTIQKRYDIDSKTWLSFDTVAAGIDLVGQALRECGYAVLRYDTRGLWGTAEAYQLYRMLQIMAEMHCMVHGATIGVYLHHALIGLEGKRVAVTIDGAKRIGYIGTWGKNVLKHTIRSKKESKRGSVIMPYSRVEVLNVIN